MDPVSVESFCNLLARSRLLPPEDIRTLPQRWRKEAGSRASTVEEFARWLTAKDLLTEYQASLLLRGHAQHLFLNDYKLLDRIGVGRMAGVYKAVHELGQVVAIKVLPPSRARDAQAFARFQREARLAVRLKHPNVVRTFQVGEADGVHYLVMEYLEGETLEEVLKRRKRLPPAEAVRLVHQALKGLSCVHAAGMVHRDLKPGNLMLVPARTAGQADTTLQATVKLLDIGLGRALFDEGVPEVAAATDLTVPGQILGNPDYLAPEQARDAHAADIRADIYSLGCVLYHALAGQVPFPGNNPVQKIVRHATEAPRPVKQLNPEVPDGLQQILDWMLAREPAKRYPTPERAAQALQVFLTSAQDSAAVPVAPQTEAYLKWLAVNAGPEEVPGEVPVPVPVAPPRSARPERAPGPDDVDVELVPLVPSQGAVSPRTSLLSSRDLILLAAGAGGLLLVGVLAWLLLH